MKVIFLPKESLRAKRVRGFLVILLVAQIVNLGLFSGLQLAKAKGGDLVYKIVANDYLR